jgi:DNA-binding LytR/AlgR family response regulator
MLDGTVVPGYKTLKKYESILPENFLRIHRSYIINRDYIKRVQFGNQTCTLQTNQTKLPFTKSFIDNINLINSFYSGLPELSN